MDKEALASVKNLIIEKSKKHGISEDVASIHADNIIEELSHPDGSPSFSMLSGLVTALMFDGAERDDQLKDLIVTVGPQVIPYLDEEKQVKLQAAIKDLVQ
ncbi:hypothetical protein KW506_03330 [Vibrio fluvialis]|nr:hypothetical protein [Vibrio fluvialis]